MISTVFMSAAPKRTPVTLVDWPNLIPTRHKNASLLDMRWHILSHKTLARDNLATMKRFLRAPVGVCIVSFGALASLTSALDNSTGSSSSSSSIPSTTWKDCNEEDHSDVLNKRNYHRDRSPSSTTAPATCHSPSMNASYTVSEQTTSLSASSTYTAFDDASWAIASSNMTNRLNSGQKEFYETFMDECMSLMADCQEENEKRIFMNVHQPPSVKNYTQRGFAKIRAPPALMDLLTEFWELNKDTAEMEADQAGPFHNTWKYPTELISVEDDKFVGGGWNLSAAIWNSTKGVLEEWTGQKLAGSSVYGIRIYNNNSVLAPHVDRLPLSK